jgi:hypothetical protein
VIVFVAVVVVAVVVVAVVDEFTFFVKRMVVGKMIANAIKITAIIDKTIHINLFLPI